jgi:hypothetical protein
MADTVTKAEMRAFVLAQMEAFADMMGAEVGVIERRLRTEMNLRAPDRASKSTPVRSPVRFRTQDNARVRR